MRLVLDASVIVKLVAEEPGSAEARRLLRETIRGGGTIHAPDHAAAETLNALWKQAHLHRLTPEQTLAAAQDLQTLLRKITFTSTQTLLEESIRLSLTHDNPVYDTLYIAAAQLLEATLVTADKPLQTLAGDTVKTILI